MNEIKEGFYYLNQMPIPQNLKMNENLITKLRMIMYRLDNTSYENAHCEQYMGFSRCRICNINNGSKEYYIIDKNNMYIFPEGFLHYIEAHNILPSEDFIDLLKNINGKFFKNEINKTTLIKYDKQLQKFRSISIEENILNMNNGIGCLHYSN